MSRQEAIQQFRQALKAGQKCYRECVHRGRYPYPQVLEERLRDCAVAGRVDLGVLDIPIAQIIGTNTAGRQAAFAANFMPLLDLGTEFAGKWVALCEAHLGDTGITDPIRCFEYMGSFYVQEGNKRVSVLKSFDAPTIRAYVTRVLPVYSDDPAVRVYYEFLHFYGLCGLYQVHFNRVGDYPKLQAALGFDADHVWSEREKRAFLTAFYTFRTAYYKLSQEPPVTTAEALLVWLHTYTLGDLRVLGPAELEKSIRAVWTELTAYARGGKIEMQTDAEPEASGSGLLGLLAGRMIPGGTLRAAFVHECAPEKSPWIREHDKGRQQLEQALGDTVLVRSYLAEDYPCAEDALEQAVSDGAQVIFTTTVPLIFACRKLAPKYPGVRFLNCSVDMPYPGVRTYYSRIYEAKFLLGVIAGALAVDDRIGYVADYPSFGVPANINAFALGARMVNPRARIELRWTCLPDQEDPLAVFTRKGITVVSGRDAPVPGRPQQEFGTFLIRPGGVLQDLATPFWHWGQFYENVVHSVLDGGWVRDKSGTDGRAVNYWWGMNSGVMDVLLSRELPSDVAHLARILRTGVTAGMIDPFACRITDQNGTVRNSGRHGLDVEQIVHMDYLCDAVDGTIPEYDDLTEQARPMYRMQGIHRDQLPAEKEATL